MAVMIALINGQLFAPIPPNAIACINDGYFAIFLFAEDVSPSDSSNKSPQEEKE